MAVTWNKKTYALITGASRGIGREIAEDFATRLGPDSLIVLVARSKDGLEETKDKILTNNPHIKVEICSLDLSHPDKQEMLDLVQKSVITPDSYEYSILVHNAGSLGDLAKNAGDLNDVQELQDYFTFNVFSMMVLNHAFLTVFNSPQVPRLIINITSLCALKPMNNFALYCAGKATREMFLNVLSLEEPNVKILHYSPGPVLTAMADEILTKCPSEETRTMFQEMRDNGGYLSTQQTIHKLVQVLDADKFKSGDHVDYFDEI